MNELPTSICLMDVFHRSYVRFLCHTVRTFAAIFRFDQAANIMAIKCGTLSFQPLGVGTNKWGTDPQKFLDQRGWRFVAWTVL